MTTSAARRAVISHRADGYLPIESYAAIGDCRTMALVGADGSLDWFCWPRFDSPPIFSKLIDRNGGYFLIAPETTYKSRREYRPDSNVLVTRFECDGGACEITDLFAAIPAAERRKRLLPETLVIRRVRCLGGEVPLVAEFEPRSGWDGPSTSFRRTGESSIVTMLPNYHIVHLAADLPLEIGETGAGARFSIRDGAEVTFALALTESSPAVYPPMNEIDEIIELTDGYWRDWAATCRPETPYRDAVVRSALVLKLLSSSESGAIIAAPTTSLPELPGGDRNWDYRYCWLRDASLTVRAFLSLGYQEEARAFTQWMLHATRESRPALKVLYDVYGRQPGPEREIERFEGWRGARPVRIGNAAANQLQLDVYGEVVEAVAECYGNEDRLTRDDRKFIEDIVDYTRKHWREPDHGIWELRDPATHYVDSKVMCWVALDRGAMLAEKGLIKMNARRLRDEAEAIREEVETRGYSESMKSLRQVFDEDGVDAALLRTPILGFCEANDPKMAGTIANVRRRLGRGDLVYRSEKEIQRGDGAFVVCSFWLADCLARQGRTTEARELFESMLGRANDVGLFAEEIDADSGAFLGNFPLAFSHTALVNAAVAIGREEER